MVDLKKLREDLILKGKHSPKFKVVAEKYAKGNDAKYTELDNIEVSGAINQKDAEVLYNLVQKYKPKKIFEIGTWFGTSALIMATAMEWDGEIHTCDVKDYYVVDHPKIKYYHVKSSKALRQLKGMKFDMVFMDGRFKNDDCRRISRICKIFVTHDYDKGEKGVRNIREMKKRWPDAKLIKPCKGSTVATLICTK